MRQEPAGDRVARLVVRHRALLFRGKKFAALFEAADDALDGRLKVRLGHFRGALAAGNERGFVADVGNVGAGKAGGELRHFGGDGGGVGGLDLAEVDLEDFDAAGEVGQVNLDLAV